MSVNWNEPIEAYHEDGRISAAQKLCYANGDVWKVRIERYGEEWGGSVLGLKDYRQYTESLPNGYVGEKWRIRNKSAQDA